MVGNVNVNGHVNGHDADHDAVAVYDQVNGRVW
jgi:hypothetical protein